MFTTIEDTREAINNDVSGLNLFFNKILKIANMESPAPILSTGFKLKEGQEYLLSLWSNNIEPSIPFVITINFKLFLIRKFFASISILLFLSLSSALNSPSLIQIRSKFLILFSEKKMDYLNFFES